MNIDISKVVTEKLDQMQEDGTLEKIIAEQVESVITKSVISSIDSYKVRDVIDSKMKTEVSQALDKLDLSSYNQYICEQMMRVINVVAKEDACEKIKKKFEELFVFKPGPIKISEIFKKYRKYACENVEESEKYSRDEGWHCKYDTENSWIDVELGFEDKNYRYRSDAQISFTIHRDRSSDIENAGHISFLRIDGMDISKGLDLRYLNEVETLLTQMFLNKTTVIIDVEDIDDIDTSFDIDY